MIFLGMLMMPVVLLAQ